MFTRTLLLLLLVAPPAAAVGSATVSLPDDDRPLIDACPLVGARISGSGGESGRVDRILLDPATGRLAYVVVSLDGEDGTVALRWSDLTVRPGAPDSLLTFNTEILRTAIPLDSGGSRTAPGGRGSGAARDDAAGSGTPGHDTGGGSAAWTGASGTAPVQGSGGGSGMVGSSGATDPAPSDTAAGSGSAGAPGPTGTADRDDTWSASSTYGRPGAPAAVETVRGRVVRVENGTPMEGMSPGVVLILEDAAGDTQTVHLGPRWWLEGQALTFSPGEQVEVRGSRASLEGEPVLMAITVTRGDQTVSLRDESGTPRWSGQEPR